MALSPFITGNTLKESFNTRSQWLLHLPESIIKNDRQICLFEHISFQRAISSGLRNQRTLLVWKHIEMYTESVVYMQLEFLHPCVGRMTAVNVSDIWDVCGRQPGAHDEIILTNLRGNWVSFHHLHNPSWIPPWLCWLSSHESNSVNFLIKLKRKLLLLGQVQLCTYCYYLSLSTCVIMEEGTMREKNWENKKCFLFTLYSFRFLTGYVSTRTAFFSRVKWDRHSGALLIKNRKWHVERYLLCCVLDDDLYGQTQGLGGKSSAAEGKPLSPNA